MDPEFRDIREYLTSHAYPQNLNREEKVVFQYKVALYTLINGVLFKCGPDEQFRRCLEPGKRKVDFYNKVPADNEITEGVMVLLYNSRHFNFPGKLHIRWMGPFVVDEVFNNRSLQPKDLQGNLLDTKTNGSRVKLYRP